MRMFGWLLRLKQGEFGGHVLFNAPPVGKETLTGEEAFLEIVEEFVLANRCCRP